MPPLKKELTEEEKHYLELKELYNEIMDEFSPARSTNPKNIYYEVSK